MKMILTLTLNPALDVSSAVETVFPDHKLRCGPMRSDPGGGGINVSRVIKRLGGDTLAMYCQGGPMGPVLGALLEAEGIPHLAMPMQGWTRESVTILETGTNRQYRFVMPGPEFSEREWRDVLSEIEAMEKFPDYVVASGSLPPGVPENFYARLARVVRDRGGRCIIDTSGRPLALALREGIFLAKPSLRELRVFSSAALQLEEEQIQAAMDVIHQAHCESLVVSLGAGGVLLATPDGCEKLYAPSVHVQSKVGAGDSMVGGIALRLAAGRPLREAVCYGIAAGSAAVMNPGTELCHRDDVERLFRQMQEPWNRYALPGLGMREY